MEKALKSRFSQECLFVVRRYHGNLLPRMCGGAENG